MLALDFKSLGYYINLPVEDFLFRSDRVTPTWLSQFRP